MYSIDDPTAAAALPTPEAAGTEGYFTEGNPATSTAATNVRASFLNSIMLELRNLVVAAGLAPSKTNYSQVLQAMRVLAAPSIGSSRNLAMSVSAASASATLTADEIIVGAALGGQPYKLASFSKTVNLGTVGAGGMDTGSAPANGFVALYAIFNPSTGVSALLAKNATSAAAPTVYGGANMPAGYTASALVSVWPTNASGQFKIGIQADREVGFSPIAVLNSSTPQASFTLLSIASAVPLNARGIQGPLYCNTGGTGGTTTTIIAADASGTGQVQSYVGGAASSAGSASDIFYRMLLVTPQTMYYQFQNTNSGTPTMFVYVSGYSF